MGKHAFPKPSGARKLSKVLILAGPTASGKTSLAVELALKYDAEIINADSRQIYAGMEVGTAAPTHDQVSAVRHHLIGFLPPSQMYSAAQFVIDAAAAVSDIHARGKRVIIVGGTGFYIRALCGDMVLAPEHDSAIRERLRHEAETHDAAFLHEWLTARDARRAAMIAPGDAYRLSRALEIALSPTPAKERVLPTLRKQNVAFIKVVLEVDRDELDHRIQARTEAMLDSGFVQEAERIGADVPAANAVGYPHALAYLRGEESAHELRSHLMRATRRYARRQGTWFRSEPYAMWLSRNAVEPAAREFLGWH